MHTQARKVHQRKTKSPQTSCRRRGRHGESEPRSVGAPMKMSTHGMSVLPRRAGRRPTQLCIPHHNEGQAGRLYGLTSALSAPWRGDFPRSLLGSKPPVCALRSRASPAAQKVGKDNKNTHENTDEQRARHRITSQNCNADTPSVSLRLSRQWT